MPTVGQKGGVAVSALDYIKHMFGWHPIPPSAMTVPLVNVIQTVYAPPPGYILKPIAEERRELEEARRYWRRRGKQDVTDALQRIDLLPKTAAEKWQMVRDTVITTEAYVHNVLPAPPRYQPGEQLQAYLDTHAPSRQATLQVPIPHKPPLHSYHLQHIATPEGEFEMWDEVAEPGDFREDAFLLDSEVTLPQKKVQP